MNPELMRLLLSQQAPQRMSPGAQAMEARYGGLAGLVSEMLQHENLMRRKLAAQQGLTDVLGLEGGIPSAPDAPTFQPRRLSPPGDGTGTSGLRWGFKS